MTVLLFCLDQDSFTVLLGSGQFYCSVRIRTALLFCHIRRPALLSCLDQKDSFTVLSGSRVLLFCQDQDSFTVLSGSSGQLYCSVGIKKTDLLFCQVQKDSFTFLLE